ncbi:MAG: YggW family oxidoreductase [Porticoccaceae bacterium]|nr:YggW family oxidoreductase [Porticoccaceae bacterium]
MLHLPPLTLYVHVPWCVRKCPYCDFNSHEPQGGDIPEAEYLIALERDLASDLPRVQGRKLSAVFFGGGTPSLLSPATIAAILKNAERAIGFEPDIEITLEANPGTFEQDRFRGFRSAGVNRLSIGIQSFDNRHLQRLGRIHDRAAAVTAAASARAAGFDNFNLDLMHGLPEQTPAQALADLTTALALDPTHLSWYQLTIEPNTAFYKRPPVLPGEDILADIQDTGAAALDRAGFEQYEISAYARPGNPSRHNLNYWQFGDYLGIGPGAHGKITYPHTGDIIRTRKTRTPADYLARSDGGLAAEHPVPTNERPLEFFMNALRLKAGVERSLFLRRTGLDEKLIADCWQRLADRGLVDRDPQRLVTTDQGFRFLNQVLAVIANEVIL